MIGSSIYLFKTMKGENYENLRHIYLLEGRGCLN